MTDLHLLKISLGGVVGFLVWLGVTVSGGLLLVFLYFFFLIKQRGCGCLILGGVPGQVQWALSNLV